jgi:hypothetical protein
MLKKTKQLEFLNKLDQIENKVDIIQNGLNIKRYVDKDVFNYLEFREYLYVTMNQLKQDLFSSELTNNDMIFAKYTQDMMTYVDKKFHNLYHNDTDYSSLISIQNLYLQQLQESNKQIQSKLDSLYFENEAIKYHLLIDEELRKNISLVENLKVQIYTSIEKIEDVLTKKNE